MGYKTLLLTMKEARGFEKVGKRSVMLAAKQVKKDLGIQSTRSSEGAGIDMREALGRVLQRQNMARKIIAHQSSGGRSKGAGKGPSRRHPPQHVSNETRPGASKVSSRRPPPQHVSNETRPDRFSETLWEEPRVAIGLSTIDETCPVALRHRWTYPLRDESRRSFAGLLKSPLDAESCRVFFNRIRDGTDWKQPDGWNGPIPRKTGWMVAKGCTCSYRYGGIEVDAEEYPPWMTDLMELAMPFCGISDRKGWPTSCNLNLYEDGGMSVGWHADDERLFQGKFRDVRIISLSFGARRRFELRPNWPEDGERSLYQIDLEDGDICTMEGMTQKHYQHRVPREDYVSGPRINLTWRWIVRHHVNCAAERPRY